MTFNNSGLILWIMSKQTLSKAVDLAGGQAQLARGIRARMPGSKIGQVHVWGWLNQVKIEVPPADTVLPIADFLGWQMTPHDLRPDLYPNPTDALPAHVAEQVAAGTWPPAEQRGQADRRTNLVEPGQILPKQRATNGIEDHQEAA